MAMRSSSSPPLLPEEPGERAQPVLVRAERAVRDPERCELARDLRPVRLARGCECGTRLRAPRVALDASPRLGVDEPEMADVGQLVLAAGEARRRPPPRASASAG